MPGFFAAIAATMGGVIECSPPSTTGNLSRLTISASTRLISRTANGEQIRTIEQSNPVGEIQPTAGVEFCGDVFQAGGAQTRLNQ